MLIATYCIHTQPSQVEQSVVSACCGRNFLDLFSIYCTQSVANYYVNPILEVIISARQTTHLSQPETGFFYVIGTKVLRVFLLAIDSHLY